MVYIISGVPEKAAFEQFLRLQISGGTRNKKKYFACTPRSSKGAEGACETSGCIRKQRRESLMNDDEKEKEKHSRGMPGPSRVVYPVERFDVS